MTACCSSGLLSSRMTVSGLTFAPGRSTIRSTRPWVVAANPADVFRDQRARPADLTQHRARA